jgi:CHAT domain-containing protein
LAFLRRSVEAIQAQSRRLAGSDDARVAFRAHYHEYHRDLEELLLNQARPEEAFGAVEASRARTLLALMTYRDLDLARDVSPELERERRHADTEHDRVVRRLGAARDAAQRAALRQELRQARQRQDEVRAKIRAAAPRLAAVRDPQPLDLSGVRRVVAPDTLILVYSLGGENSRLYAVGPGPEDFSVSRLDIGEVALREEVRRFRESIQTTRGRLRRRALLDQSRRLGQILLSPIQAQLARAERVLIVPDGALHALPFGALGLPAPRGQHRFLVQTKPLHTASSVTLYAELVRPQEAENPRRGVVGFGDPQYPRGSAGDGPQALRSALRSGLRLDPLPWTRSELKALGLLAPEKPQLWLGSEATEERAKALGAQHRIIHFACHGLLDEAFPLESGLALSIPAESKEGGENGLLQAWEIFESLRIDADLVTLSACQTALGKEVAGEGLLGLTWAFQYAGARSVLASLWEVSDASTADLMRHFYGQLGRGVSKAEALRRAQLELLKHPATAAPFYWAAFELIGDWR